MEITNTPAKWNLDEWRYIYDYLILVKDYKT